MITTGAKLLENKRGNEEIRRKEGGHTRGARGKRNEREDKRGDKCDKISPPLSV
jgi:hypothetical protein